jgi:transcriptional regulator of acetoin/glycerol metabolism
VFEQADGGTLFLDEIGELPLALQARLLRALESGEVRRVGAESARKVDVRVVCATHRDLRAMVAEGAFRQDLYFRIARVVLEVPPLRARGDDMVLLASHFLSELAPVVGPKQLSEQALVRLRGHTWPGNVRELRNVLSAAAFASAAPRIERAEFERALDRLGATATRGPSADNLREVIEQHGGNVSAAARALGLSRSTLRDRLKLLGVAVAGE